MPNIGYLNGQFIPLEQVQVSAEDRGYQFGDGVYEVIRTYRGIPFGMDDHLDRLERSAREIRISTPLSRQEWVKAILEGIHLSGYENCKVYIQVTRGTSPREHKFSSLLVPTILITFREMMELAAHYYEHGVQAITLPDIRWGRCDIKSLNLLPNVLAKQKASEVGAFEAVFIRDGFVTEGATSNVVIVQHNVISTPELNEQLLPGVTRKYVMTSAGANGYEVQERKISSHELHDVNEMFLVGTTIDVLPLTRLDGRKIGTGMPGPLTRSLMTMFSETIEKSSAISNH